MTKNSNTSHSNEQPIVNRNHKDRLFRFIFQDKASLLMLYNALNGTDYQNPELMENCRPLMEYSVFIEKIRHYEALSLNIGDAVTAAVNDCIHEGILKDLLLKHQSEVTSMILDEYNEQQHIENEKRWSLEEGLARG
ncbi:MAG: hypothetical protein Q4B70_04440, partial [Lachnospiraceae bacterium]|nr:hypothetical protein [Lachnospiraceae bacterium]